MLMIFRIFAEANEKPEKDANPDLCDAGAMLQQLSY